MHGDDGSFSDDADDEPAAQAAMVAGFDGCGESLRTVAWVNLSETTPGGQGGLSTRWMMKSDFNADHCSLLVTDLRTVWWKHMPERDAVMAELRKLCGQSGVLDSDTNCSKVREKITQAFAKPHLQKYEFSPQVTGTDLQLQLELCGAICRTYTFDCECAGAGPSAELIRDHFILPMLKVKNTLAEDKELLAEKLCAADGNFDVAAFGRQRLQQVKDEESAAQNSTAGAPVQTPKPLFDDFTEQIYKNFMAPEPGPSRTEYLSCASSTPHQAWRHSPSSHEDRLTTASSPRKNQPAASRDHPGRVGEHNSTSRTGRVESPAPSATCELGVSGGGDESDDDDIAAMFEHESRNGTLPCEAKVVSFLNPTQPSPLTQYTSHANRSNSSNSSSRNQTSAGASEGGEAKRSPAKAELAAKPNRGSKKMRRKKAFG